MFANNDVVAAAVATLLFQNKKILLGRRLEKNQFMGWQCPGGYLQQGETPEQSAKRHCLQKAGIEITELGAGPYSNNIFSGQQHTVTLYVIAQSYRIQNPHCFKNEKIQWQWFATDELPEALFLPLKILTAQQNISDLFAELKIKNTDS